MAGETGSRAGVEAAQVILQRSASDLIADGRWGSFTQRAYDSAPAEDRIEVDATLRSFGLDAVSLDRANKAAKAARDTAYVAEKQKARSSRERFASPPPEIAAAIKAAAVATGVDETALTTTIGIESSFNPLAYNGSSRGLGQFQPGAWAGVQQIDPSLGSYEQNVWDPVKNARATALYMKLNQRYLKGAGYTGPMTPGVLYLAHQQGAGGATEMWHIVNGRQPKTHYITERKMKGNPPHDKQGVTLDRDTFARRWWAVAERKFGPMT